MNSDQRRLVLFFTLWSVALGTVAVAFIFIYVPVAKICGALSAIFIFLAFLNVVGWVGNPKPDGELGGSPLPENPVPGKWYRIDPLWAMQPYPDQKFWVEGTVDPGGGVGEMVRAMLGSEHKFLERLRVFKEREAESNDIEGLEPKAVRRCEPYYLIVDRDGEKLGGVLNLADPLTNQVWSVEMDEWGNLVDGLYSYSGQAPIILPDDYRKPD